MSKSYEIPSKIENPERIVRVLMDPRHFKSKEHIKWNCFRPPPEIDEISVIRIDYCDEQFCKDWGKHIEQFDTKNTYYGFAVLFAEEIRKLECDVKFTPSKETHEFHADIMLNYILEKGKPPPSEIKYRMEQMAAIARKYKDSQPEKKEWVDGFVD